MLLITSSEVISLAFNAREQISTMSIRPLKIDIAQEHFIRPRFGDLLFDRMCEGQYADFVDRYIKPALAHYVRYGVIDELSVGISDNGAIVYGSLDESIDRNAQSDKTESQTKNESGSVAGLTTESNNDVTSQKSNQTRQLERESFTDPTIPNYPLQTVAETLTTKGDSTSNVITDSTINKSEQSTVEDMTTGAHKGVDSSSQSRLAVSYRAASSAERRVIVCRALSDGNVLLAKAVRYVERNIDQFELYLPSSVSSRAFF